MPKPPESPLRPLAVSLTADKLKIIVPITAIALLVLALTPGLALMLTPARAPPAPVPRQQDWAVDANPLPVLTSLSLGKLPPPDPRQRHPPCDPDIEKEIEGSCWIPLALATCPEGKAFQHEGHCYGRALNAARVPTSGEPRTGGVADH